MVGRSKADTFVSKEALSMRMQLMAMKDKVSVVMPWFCFDRVKIAWFPCLVDYFIVIIVRTTLSLFLSFVNDKCSHLRAFANMCMHTEIYACNNRECGNLSCKSPPSQLRFLFTVMISTSFVQSMDSSKSKPQKLLIHYRCVDTYMCANSTRLRIFLVIPLPSEERSFLTCVCVCVCVCS